MSSKKVLIIDDDWDCIQYASTILTKEGISSIYAVNGQEGLDKAKKEKPDLIILDVQMPIMDGHEATIAIREREKLSGNHQPIIAMTAHAMKGDKEKCLAVGMDGYISKPFKVDEVFQEIRRVFTTL